MEVNAPWWWKMWILPLPFGLRLRIHTREGISVFSIRKKTVRTIHFHATGPLIKYGDGILYVEDLNPEMKTKWRMSRMDMLRMAWCTLLAAVR